MTNLEEQGGARRRWIAALAMAACLSPAPSCNPGGDGADRVGRVELASSGTCPVTITVPTAGQAVGQYIQIQVTQSCTNWTNAMIAYIDNQRCDQAPYPFPNPGCATTGGAQNFSTSTWVKVAPGTHHIVVNNWNAQGVVGVSSSVTFTYAPPVLAGAGDIACNLADRSSMPCYDAQSGAALAGINPTYAFTLGDNQYENGKLDDYRTYYGASWGVAALLGKTRPVVGNHEYNGNADYTGCHTSTANFCTASAYMKANYGTYFTDELSALDPSQNGWYSYDVATPYGEPWHVVVLNGAICDPSSYPSECSDPSTCWSNAANCNSSSAQYAWLVSDLGTFHVQHPNAHCVLAMWHEPRFSSGEHGSNATFQPFWQALYDAHAEIVLNGHDHNYERFGPQTPSGGADAAHGIVQFTVGTGGRDDTGCNAAKPNSRLCVDHAYGVLELTLHNGSADYAFVNADTGDPGVNLVNDSGTIVCHD